MKQRSFTPRILNCDFTFTRGKARVLATDPSKPLAARRTNGVPIAFPTLLFGIVLFTRVKRQCGFRIAFERFE